MSRNKERSSSKEQYWRRMVRLWRNSGLSVRAFCEKHGLSQPSFYGWRRTLAQRDEAAVRFVPVQVVPEPESAAESGPGTLVLVLSTGRRLRIEPGFDGPTLTRLLALLEEGRP
jgi:transposase